MIVRGNIMEFYLISENKIKVTLTNGELSEFGIQYLNEYSVHQSTLKPFLEMIHKKTGFDTSGKLTVKMYSSDTGTDFYITREKAAVFSDDDSLPYIFSFDSLSSLLGACRYISTSQNECRTSVYYELLSGATRYYLLIYIGTYGFCSDVYPLSVICEYSDHELQRKSSTVSYITEKCTVWGKDNAAELLSVFY